MVGRHRYVSKVPSSCSKIISLFRRTNLFVFAFYCAANRSCVCVCVNSVCVCVCTVLFSFSAISLLPLLFSSPWSLSPSSPSSSSFSSPTVSRALQHLVSPHDLRQTPWHKSVRTLVARPFRISLILFQTSYIAVT